MPPEADVVKGQPLSVETGEHPVEKKRSLLNPVEIAGTDHISYTGAYERHSGRWVHSIRSEDQWPRKA